MSSTPREQGERERMERVLAYVMEGYMPEGEDDESIGSAKRGDDIEDIPLTFGDQRWLRDLFERLRTPSGETDAGGEPMEALDGEIKEALDEDRDLNNAGALSFFFRDFYRPEYDARKSAWEKVTEDEIEEAAIEAALVQWKAMHDELDAEDRALASTDTEGGA